MRRRHPLPKLWLLTDERQGAPLGPGLPRRPRAGGGAVRHYSLPAADRRRLFARITALGRARGWTVLLAGDAALARAWRADGHYGPAGRSGGLHMAPVHDRAEGRAAERAHADLLVLSPLFPTRSHPGAKTLGTLGFAVLARTTRLPVIALGGVTKRHATLVKRLGAHGWAGIDAFTAPDQKRNAVPI